MSILTQDTKLSFKHDDPLPMDYRQLVKLLRAWGWSFVSEGVKEAQFKKGTHRVTVRRVKTGFGKMAPVIEAARVESIHPSAWLEGPPEKPADTQQSTQPPEPAQEARGASVTPLPVKADAEGYITLTDALALRGLKINELSRTACEIIATLAQGTIEDEKGAATRKLWERLPSVATKSDRAPETTGVSMQLKHWEAAGLVWRELNPGGKRTYKIGLCVPVKLSNYEYNDYVWTGAAPIQPEPVIEPEAEPPRMCLGPPDCLFSKVRNEWMHSASCDHSSSKREPEPDPEPVMSMEPAIEALQKELEHADKQIALWEARKRAVNYAINVLMKGSQ